MPEEHKYKMTMSLNILNHLGIDLYSNTPAVLSEVVANSWDADAKNVDITIMDDDIVITDNGLGMTVDNMNRKFLNVGYQKREKEGDETPEGRPLMGRKGIGKLSLFSIANTIKVESIKGGEKHGLLMSAEGIKDAITEENDVYNPEELKDDELTISEEVGRVKIHEQGTRITISDLKRGLSRTRDALKKRIARRFSIFGSEYDFIVYFNNEKIGIEDRDYYHKIQYIWYFGKESEKFKGFCNDEKLEHDKKRVNIITVKYNESKENKEVKEYKITGWIGTVANSGELKDQYDNLNKITILVRGKLAQEDILEDFAEGGLFSKYLIGEIHADFLDITGEAESATSNRQEIKKDDERYIALRNFVYWELKHIQKTWTDLRKGKGTEEAQSIPAIADWFNSLKGDDKNHARSLFGKIGQLKVDKDEERRELYKQSVLAFENMKYKRNLKALELISIENLEEFTRIIANIDDIEATLYHQIIKERLSIINKLHRQVEDGVLEKVIQKYLYGHLWLLDPSWDRATETPQMEEAFSTMVKKLDSHGLSGEEKRSRFDIKYKNPSKKHVIIELKKSDVYTNRFDLGKQVDKYKRAFEKILRSMNIEDEPVEVICLVGKPLTDWNTPKAKEESIRAMEESNVRVILYRELIQEAYKSYSLFLEKNAEASSLTRLLESIELEEYT
ncbi:ATP-binding protein [candidate division KSB1 bacterium]|nr:ATP-binding protein [candidate division KSB1 bacterium]